MNFFKLYLGDYLRDTGTLSVAEHGAYLLMLVHLYGTEKPLPTGKELYRLLRAETKTEREAVDAVVSKFFYSTDAGLRNKRADAEMVKAEHQRTVNRSVGKLGGRPKRTETESVSESEPNHNPNQTPDTRHQTKDLEPSALVVSASPPRLPACPVDEIVSRYHEHLPMLPRVEVMSDGRRRSLASRWREVITDPEIRAAEDPKGSALEWWAWYFQHAAKSKFLTGKTKDWRADFDFLIAPRTFAKTVEGSYHKEAA